MIFSWTWMDGESVFSDLDCPGLYWTGGSGVEWSEIGRSMGRKVTLFLVEWSRVTGGVVEWVGKGRKTLTLSYFTMDGWMDG